MTTIQSNPFGNFNRTDSQEIVLTEHDRDRSSGLPFFAGVIGYLIALPAIALACASLGVF